jgi:Rha family phage regulatory protein
MTTFLRAIRNLIGQRPELGARNFAETFYIDESNRQSPCYDMDRRGFSALAMRFTGAKALDWQLRYIDAFDAMEQEILNPTGLTTETLLLAVREIVSPLAVRFDSQDQSLVRVENRVDEIGRDVSYLKTAMWSKRQLITSTVKAHHVADVDALGGRCPCCGQATIVTNGQKSKFSEFDHFYANSKRDEKHTWLICSPCHSGLTTGRVERHEREPQFKTYQANRMRLPGRMPSLFG